MNLTFTCEVCGNSRPNEKISVKVFDRSLKYELPTGTMKRMVNYCNDNIDCKKGTLKMKL